MLTPSELYRAVLDAAVAERDHAHAEFRDKELKGELTSEALASAHHDIDRAFQRAIATALADLPQSAIDPSIVAETTSLGTCGLTKDLTVAMSCSIGAGFCTNTPASQGPVRWS
jgi:hypothetical protein